MIAKYRTQPGATMDGKGHFCEIERQTTHGRFINIGRTKNYRVYPAGVRAEREADAIIRRDAERQGFDGHEIERR